MGFSAIFGVILALSSVGVAHYLDGGYLRELVNLPAATIVLGGTLAAAFIQFRSADVRRAAVLLRWAFSHGRQPHKETLESILRWCVIARRKGLLGLEAEAEKLSDEFIKSGLQLLADGKGRDNLRSTLEVDMVMQEQRDLQAARVIESMGGYAPTMGIIGAVLGLIHVMGNLSDPESLGRGIATAFVATVYGIGLANLLLLPIGNKIKDLVQARYRHQEMVLEGLMLIADGHGPKAIQQRLQGYLGG
ncbi:flagellar motor protein [Pontibacter sp. JAM-7]|uniref:flagellar motor protein n=1 Tax=Pontibacter sp. JAM-7 TaxID=3366581 RepID=UPI003AF993F7